MKKEVKWIIGIGVGVLFISIALSGVMAKMVSINEEDKIGNIIKGTTANSDWGIPVKGFYKYEHDYNSVVPGGIFVLSTECGEYKRVTFCFTATGGGNYEPDVEVVVSFGGGGQMSLYEKFDYKFSHIPGKPPEYKFLTYDVIGEEVALTVYNRCEESIQISGYYYLTSL
jgi:hypothetical protein